MCCASCGRVFSSEDQHLGLYGALGYDLAFQFEKIDFVLPREADQRDMVLFLPDSIFIRDHERQEAFVYHYEFNLGSRSTEGLARTGQSPPYVPAPAAPATATTHPVNTPPWSIPPKNISRAVIYLK